MSLEPRNTLASLFLGSRFAGESVVSLDRDLLIHPDDLQNTLQIKGQFIGITETTTEDPVYVKLNYSTQPNQVSESAGRSC